MNHAEELLDSLDEALIELDYGLTFLYINRKAELLWEIERAEVLGMNISDSLEIYFGQPGANSVRAALRELKKKIGSYYSQLKKRWFFFSVNPSKASLLLTFYNVPPLGSKEIDDTDLRIKQAQAEGHIGSFERLFSEQKVYWSDELYHIHGIVPQSEEITVSRLMEFVHPDEDEEVRTALRTFHEQGKPISCIHRIVTVEGFTRLVHRTAEVLYDDNGKPWKIFGTVQDISDLKDAEEEIRNRNRFLREAEAMGYTGSYEGDFKTMSLHFSEGLFNLFGYEVNGFLPSMDFIDSVSHPDDIEPVRNIIETARSTGQAYEYTRRIFRPDGEMRYLYSKGRIVHDKNGDPVKFLGTVHDITEQKEAEIEITRTKDLLQAVFDASTHPITLFESVKNPDGDIVDFIYVLENEVSRKLWKNGRIGQSLLGLRPGIEGTPIFELYKAVSEGGAQLDSELYLNGEWIKGWFRLTAVKREQFIVATIEDISQRKLIESSLKKNLHVLTEAEAIVKMGSWEYDVVGQNTWWSPGMYRIFSSAKKPLSIKEYKAFIVPENWEIAERIANCMERTFKPFDEVFTIQEGGQRKIIQSKGSPLKNADGLVETMVGINKDITEKVLADLELKKQSHFINQIAEATPDIINLFNVETFSVTYVNSNITAVTGYTAEEVLGQTESDIKLKVHPDDWNAYLDFYKAIQNSNDKDIQEIVYRVKNVYNKWIWLAARGKIFQKDASGKVIDVIIISQDVTEKVKALRELDYQNYFIQKITQATPDIIMIFDLVSRSYVYINKELFPIVGITSKELKSMDFEQSQKILCPDDLPAVTNYLNSFKDIRSSEVREVEYRIKNREGKWWWVKARGKVFKRNQLGTPVQIISIVQDYSQTKEAEEKRRQNEFMQALLQKKDEFMSVASHELKTPITSIKASLQILQRQIEKHVDESVLLVFVTKAILQINKLIILIADLMDNTKIQAGKLQLNITLCFMDEIISDTIVHGFGEHQIIIDNSVDEPLEVDKIRIEQVLTNFLTNAIKYSPGSKKIVLRAIRDGEMAKIEVQDFGIGIPKEKLDFVFDRFFRADESSTQFSGLGLGLYISAEIIKQHYGEYGVESEEGKGSIFWFKIPFKHEMDQGQMLSET